MNNVPFSHIVGPLPPGSAVYIQREADEEIVRHIRRGEYVQLSEPRDQGKTSLIYQLRSRLDGPTCKIVYVNVTSLKKAKEADWYGDLHERILLQLRDFLDTNGLSLVPNDCSSWRSFLQHLMASRTKQPGSGLPLLILVLDEVENIPLLWSASFFQIMHDVNTSRSLETNFKRLSFILSGTFSPQLLSLDNPLSRILQRVNVKDFDEEQVLSMVRTLSLTGQETLQREDMAARLFYWTDGQPYLTQWLSRYLEYIAENGGAVTLESIDNAVGELLRENNDHLLYIRRKLTEESALLNYVNQASRYPILYSPSPDVNSEQFQLVHVYGLLKVDSEGNCQLRNRIYELWLQTGTILHEWEQRLTTYLRTQGQITQQDSHIPAFAWRGVVSRYQQDNSEHLPIDITASSRMRLKRGVKEVSELDDALQEASQELRRGQHLEPTGSLGHFTRLLQETVGLKSSGQWKSRGMLQATMITIKSNTFYNFNEMPKTVPIFFIPASEISTQIDMTTTLASLAGELGTAQIFSFVVLLSPTVEDEEIDELRLHSTLRSSRSPYDFVLLSRDALIGIFTDRDPHAALLRYIARQVSPQTVSPFIVQGAVTANTGMFYGREKEVTRITHGLQARSFVVVGNRRIGKSSLLGQIRQNLEKNPRYYVASFDYQGHGTPTPQMLRANFAQLEQEANGRKIVQFIDEIDELLIQDEQQRYRCGAVWRELSETGRCRFVFAGHRILRRILLDVRSPFFNFAEAIHLGFFNERFAHALLADPLRHIGFILQPEQDILERVWQITSGHPNIIQVIGRELLEQLERGNMVITREHLEQLLKSRRFQEEYEGAMWGGQRASNDFGVSPLERIILLLGNPGGFNEEEIERLLRQNRIQAPRQQIYNALDLLTDFDLLNKEGNRYTCNVKYFRRFVLERYDKKYLLDIYKEAMAE